MKAIRRSLYGKMAGDTTLVAFLATPPAGYSKSIYYQLAPETATLPFVVFSQQSGTPVYSFAERAYDNDLWLVKAVDRSGSADVADDIHARLDALLTDGVLSISGRDQLYLRRESDLEYSETVGGDRYVHAGSLFRVIYA
jgi:hypothetical protein